MGGEQAVQEIPPGGRSGVALLEAMDRPSLVLEQRAAVEFAELLTNPVYYGFGVPRGDGHTVLLVPGFLGSDSYLTVLSGWLRRIGYRPAMSGITFNAGSITRLIGQVERRAESLAKNGRISIVGHSLGGVFARLIAVKRPDLIEHAITLGSPLVGDPRDAAHPLVRALGDVLIHDLRSKHEEALFEQLAGPLPQDVHLTSIYSREDPVVAWRACMDEDPNAECYEVRGTHCGMAWNVAVYRILADVLLG